MALHAEVRANDKHLVGAVSIGQKPGGTGWNAECFAMPLKNRVVFARQFAQPVFGKRIVFAGRVAPANFLDRVAGDLAAQRLAH
jgi:hypothetical protein